MTRFTQPPTIKVSRRKGVLIFKHKIYVPQYLLFHTTFLAAKKNFRDTWKYKNKQSKDTKQSLEPGWDMTQMLELTDREFRIDIINMLKAIMEKINGMQDQTANFSRDIKIIKKNKRKCNKFKTQ